MKNLLTSIFCSLFLSLIGQSQNQHLKTVTIESEHLNQMREIVIYKSANYDVTQSALFNVIYVFDAHDQALFDYAASVAQFAKEGHPGFLIVGIKATYIESLQYGRNNDLLPSGTTFRLGPAGGNADNYLQYVKNEVIPYVENNYRTLPRRTGVGHSLGASFLLYGMVNNPDLFDNYIAVSPNLSYDNNYLVSRLKNFDSKQFETPKYLYLSHANEAIDTSFWPGWKEAIQKAYPVVDELKNENFIVKTGSFPNKLHREGFIPAYLDALDYFFTTIENKQEKILSEKTYEVTFRIKVPNKDDEIYITGNQESLAYWDPGKIKLKATEPFLREITLKVQDPVMAKFTRGSWESEAWIKIEDGQANFPIMKRPKDGDIYSAEILSFGND
ncbi:MAG: alpha/beta hydrolase-fold protein [Bacteroidota bacterium]